MLGLQAHAPVPASCRAADKVDVLSWRKKSGRVHAQIRDMCAILCGLVVAQVRQLPAGMRRGEACRPGAGQPNGSARDRACGPAAGNVRTIDRAIGCKGLL